MLHLRTLALTFHLCVLVHTRIRGTKEEQVKTDEDVFSSLMLSLSPVRPEVREMTSLGAAVAAGLAQGVWSDSAHLPTLQSSTFQPSISPDSESLTSFFVHRPLVQRTELVRCPYFRRRNCFWGRKSVHVREVSSFSKRGVPVYVCMYSIHQNTRAATALYRVGKPLQPFEWWVGLWHIMYNL